MTKRELIDEILQINPSAEPGFLAGFNDTELDDYLGHLHRAQSPRLSGDAGRFDKYFLNLNETNESLELSDQPAVCATATGDEQAGLESPSLDADEPFCWNSEPEDSDDEKIQQRIEQFARQWADELSAEQEANYCRHVEPATAGDAKADELQPTTNRLDSLEQDNDTWLF